MVSIAGFGMAFSLVMAILLGINILTYWYEEDYNSVVFAIFWWDDSLPVLGLYPVSSLGSYLLNYDILGVIFAAINVIFGVEILGLSLTKVLLLIYNTFKIYLVYYRVLLPIVTFKMQRGASVFARG